MAGQSVYFPRCAVAWVYKQMCVVFSGAKQSVSQKSSSGSGVGQVILSELSGFDALSLKKTNISGSSLFSFILLRGLSNLAIPGQAFYFLSH